MKTNQVLKSNSSLQYVSPFCQQLLSQFQIFIFCHITWLISWIFLLGWKNNYQNQEPCILTSEWIKILFFFSSDGPSFRNQISFIWGCQHPLSRDSQHVVHRIQGLLKYLSFSNCMSVQNQIFFKLIKTIYW